VIVFLGQAAGALSVVAEEGCGRICLAERLDGQCAPACVCMTCNAQHRPLVAAAGIALPVRCPLCDVVAQAELKPAVPEPSEIQHIPKTSPV
jgi:hypothetical protein